MTLGVQTRPSMFLIPLIVVTCLCCSGSQRGDNGSPNDGAANASGEEMSAEERLVADRCDGCHGLDTVYGESRSREEWAAEVDRMIGRGARLDDDERRVVIDYLSSR